MADNEPPSWEQVGLAAALATTYAEDQRDFLPFLAGLLEKALLPGQIVVKRKPIRMFSSQTKVVSIELLFDEEVFIIMLAPDGHRLETVHKKAVRGITLKTETPPVHVWLALIGERLQALAAQNETAHNALQDFMEFERH